MDNLVTLARKTQEAQAVRLGLPIDRRFSDAELAGSMAVLADAERDLELEFFGRDPRDESGCPLSEPERQLLGGLDRRLIAFDITVTTMRGVETLRMLAPDACSANIRAVEMLFGECMDDEKPQAFKIDVRPVKMVAELRRAA